MCVYSALCVYLNFTHSPSLKIRVPCDDKEGHYIIVPDDMIHSRCTGRLFRPVSSLTCHLSDRTVRLLGQGTFGEVVEAIDPQK